MKENNKPKSGVSVSLTVTAVQYSGGHSHNGNRPVGRLADYSNSTGSDGKFQTTYTASAFGGTETIKATAAGKTASVSLNIRIAGLRALGSSRLYQSTGGTEYHPLNTNHYGTRTTRRALVNIALDYGREFPDKLRYNDISLEKGGLFDIGPPYGSLWSPPHRRHRTGWNCDVGIPQGRLNQARLRLIIREHGGHIHPESNHWHLTF